MTIDCAQEKLRRESRQGGDEREGLKMAVRPDVMNRIRNESIRQAAQSQKDSERHVCAEEGGWRMEMELQGGGEEEEFRGSWM